MAQANDPMAEIRASFFVECDELLESLQDALVTMDEGEHDSETINVVFRAVHSIKGGAGAFGLSALVAFAHRFETVMDEVRSGRMEVTSQATKLFFQAADILQDHVRSARDNAPPPDGVEEVLQPLEYLMGGVKVAEEVEASDYQPMAFSLDLGLPDLGGSDDGGAGFGAGSAETRPRLITFKPHIGLYTSGNEPYHILRALRELGEAQVSCDISVLPRLDQLDPESALLSWEVRLPAEVTDHQIREVFDFVEDVCSLEIGNDAPLPSLSLAGLGSSDTATEDAPVTPDPTPPAPPSGPPPSGLPAAAAASVAAAPAAPVAERRISENDRRAPTEAAATVRVDLDRIDRLVNLVGELVINQAMLAQSVAEAGLPPNSAVMTGLEAFMMLTRDIQDSVMMIRAQPVKPLFQRMARIVREASGAVGKQVRLKPEGEACEIDKTVIERLADPLTHMIRNAVDHGLEMPEDRIAAGKPAEGVITLSAQHRAGRVVIEVSDDGAGIDRPKVRKIAISKGLIPADAQLSDSEIDALLFLPGFSTATTVSALSGRGVGMDVVKSAITSLGGRVTITSERGVGTTFSISLPLTLAVLDGMVVHVAGETLVVPLSSIIETATLGKDDIRSLGPETNVIHIRGGFVPLYDLGVELGYRKPKASYAGGIVLLTAGDDGSRAALVVDAILEQRQVVIKGLQQAYGHIPGVAAATILGDGQIALILDPPDLVQNANGRTRISQTPELAQAG